jgi:hypothetical protein
MFEAYLRGSARPRSGARGRALSRSLSLWSAASYRLDVLRDGGIARCTASPSLPRRWRLDLPTAQKLLPVLNTDFESGPLADPLSKVEGRELAAMNPRQHFGHIASDFGGDLAR